jgi:hypothetical protein
MVKGFDRWLDCWGTGVMPAKKNQQTVDTEKYCPEGTAPL